MPILTPSRLQATEELSLSPELLDFFNNIVWGTDEVLYRVPDWRLLLRDLPSPRYLTLQKKGRPVAARMLLKKSLFTPGARLPAFYHSLFSVASTEKGHGYGKQLAEITLQRLCGSLVDGGLIYAYVEAGNVRSEAITRSLGYEKFGEFQAITFSRLFPKPLPTVQALSAVDCEILIDKLQDLYIHHALTDFRLSLRSAHYWVLKDHNGEIIVGVQAKPQAWQIQSLAGMGGQVAMHLIPTIPVLRDLFNPQLFKFLKLGNLYFKPGCEDRVSDFLEAVLSLYGLKTAMLYVDKRSPIYRQLAKVTSFGLLNFLTQTSVNVYGYFYRMKEAAVRSLHRPLVISPLDI